ncbi:hypothetical protein R1flu_013828 [Riccia fluitans]|uniref:CRAL-TRIO domain-containing protein n=1 Tax=Riccia fluitans TaxID=41844 RepID=A0ABD1YHH6_9MARC
MAMAAATAVSLPCCTLVANAVTHRPVVAQCQYSRSISIPKICPFSKLPAFHRAKRCNSLTAVHPTHSTVAASSAQPSVLLVTEPQVEEVKKRLEKEHGHLKSGKNGRDDPALISWFLKDRKLDVDTTVAKLARALKWRSEFGVDQITDEFVAATTAKGAAYLHTHRDKSDRPTIVVVAKKHFPSENSTLETEKLCVALIEKGVDQLPPGKDTLLGIFDLRGFTSKNADWKFIRFLVDVFYEYYPKRLGEVLFIDAPFIFAAGWKAFKPILGKYSQLVRFCSVTEMEEYFTPETIPEDLKS